MKKNISRSMLLSVFLLVIFLGVGCRKVNPVVTPMEIFVTKSGAEMVRIPAGFFEMGSEAGGVDETPVHKVFLDGFLMDRYEVSQEQFRAVEISDPSRFKAEDNPVDQVNWLDAMIYCNVRSRAEGLECCYDEQSWSCDFEANGYRLATEAEWEYACRAGTETEYFFGDNADGLGDYAWYNENSSGKTHAVASKRPNPWGLYNMYGNVAEWCFDYYSEDEYSYSEGENPKGPAEGFAKVVRGGGWNSQAESCRSAYRDSDLSLDDTCLANDAVGFRCVRRLPDGKELEGAGSAEQAVVEKTLTGIVYDDIFLTHDTGAGHVESAERLIAIINKLKEAGVYSQLLEIAAKAASLDRLEAVHSGDYIARVIRSCVEGKAFLDSQDTVICGESFKVAVTAAGGVLSAVDAVMEGRIDNAFCAVRPPGHHATKDKAMGFCIFNNVAIAAKYLEDEYGLTRILIVDWDVHHGNGTQEVFYEDANVMYFSVHQSPFYPFTGLAEERGSGGGRNLNINVPLEAGAGDAEYKKVFEEKLLASALSFSPQFVLISAGFDASEEDKLGGMAVTSEGFAELTRIVKGIAERCSKGRVVSVLEGGYNTEKLAEAVEAHVRVLMD